MRNKIIFALAMVGVIAAFIAAHFMGIQHQAAAPLFAPTPNPYAAGLYAEGIIESDQPYGQNLNLYPEVAGTVTKILVKEGDAVHAGQALLTLDDSVQRATTSQLKLQADAAASTLQQLRAQPRKEQLDVAQAQWDAARANVRVSEDTYRKLSKAHELDAGAVSRESLDTAKNNFTAAQAAALLAQRQYELTRAGAWAYDIRTQENQLKALTQAYESARALLGKYVLRAPSDGVVMAVNSAVGSYVSGQGVYATYTQGQNPVIVMSGTQRQMAVRCFIDEILIHRLTTAGPIHAQLAVRGTDLKLPLEFDHVQPYVTPKIELSDQRQERVDLRVLPIVFRFTPPAGVRLYPGELVDVYIDESAPSPPPASAPAGAR